MKNLLALFMLTLAASSLSAQKLKNVAVNNFVTYQCEMKKNTVVGSGSVIVFGDTKINFTSSGYTKGSTSDVLEGASIKCGDVTFKGTVNIYLTPQRYDNHDVIKMELCNGTIDAGWTTFRIDEEKEEIYIGRNIVYRKEWTAKSEMLPVSKVPFSSNFTDRDLICGDSLRVNATYDFNGGYCLGQTLTSNKGVNYEFVSNLQYFSKVEKDGHCLKLDWNSVSLDDGRVYCSELNNKGKIDTYYSYYGLFDKEPVLEGNGIFRTASEYACEVLVKGDEFVKVSDKDNIAERKKILVNYITNPGEYSFKTFNECKFVSGSDGGRITKLIYHGKDLTSEWTAKFKESKGNAAKAEQNEYAARCKKYGKKYVDVKDGHKIPIVGMPEELLLEYGCYLKEQGSNYKWYKLAAFRCECKVTNGRVSYVYTY